MTASPIERVLGLLKDVKPRGKGWKARCPAHADEHPSLDVDLGDDGRILLICRAGCENAQVVMAMGLQMSDLYPDQQQQGPKAPVSPSAVKKRKRHPTAERAIRAAHWSITSGKYDGTLTKHAYHDAAGTVVGYTVRVDFTDGRRKEIRRVSLDGDAWMCQDLKLPKPLYRLPSILAAAPDEIILVAEGEKCVDKLQSLGFVATTSMGGAHAPLNHTDWSPLGERRAVLLPDNDDSGRTYKTGVAGQLRGVGATAVKLLELPGLRDGEDVVDFVAHREAANYSREQIVEELRTLIAGATDVPLEPPEGADTESAETEPIPLGACDPASGRLVLSPKRTLPTATSFIREFYLHPDANTLLSYAGQFLEWRGNRYVEVEEGRLLQELHPWLHESLAYKRVGGCLQLVPFEANPTSVNAALLSVRNHVLLPVSTVAPSWLSGAGPRPPAIEVMACKSMGLHIPTGQVLQPTPLLFTTNALDFDYAPDAPKPTRWLSFIEQLFGNDVESISLLQDWFGYALTADTSQQKILLLVGPRRSGKGTIARVLTRLVGAGNVCGPTVGSLSGNFGLQPLLGKSLAVVSDARFTGENVATVVERLLCISGEDAISVDRKFLGSVTMKLPTRFVFLTNELPRFNDASTALAGRFVVLRLTKSFYGQEDVELTGKLLAELPGILLWALNGWHRLQVRGRFQEPESSRTAVQDIEDLSSPVQAFVRDRCTVGPGNRVSLGDLYAAWQSWCHQDGRTSCTTKHMFGRDLAAAVPGVTRRRGTENLPFYEGIRLGRGEPPC